MFFGRSKIIYITKNTIVAAAVSGGSSPQIKKRFDAAWTSETLAQVLEQSLKNIGVGGKIRLLLGEDITYVMEFPVPDELEGAQRRSAVFEQFYRQIPEELDDLDWDYQDMVAEDGRRMALAFAPIMSVYCAVSDVFYALGCDVSTIEPEQMARLRHNDPIIGIALKQDIEGRDEEVLSLGLHSPSSNPQPDSKQQSTAVVDKQDAQQNKKPAIRKEYALILFATIIFAGVSIVGLQVSRSRLSKTPPSVDQALVAHATPAIPTPTPEVLSDYAVQVLNGSGVEGGTEHVVEELLAQGFSQADTGNADNYDYAQMIVRIKQATVSTQLQAALERALEAYDFRLDMDQKNIIDYDVVIITSPKKYEKE